MLCDYQPHPVRFVWSFLFAGLLRGYSDALTIGLGRRYLELCALGLAVDAAGFRLFLSCFAWWGWQSIGRTVAAWLLSLLVCALARAAALAVLLGRRIPSVQLSALASSAAGSSLLLTLSMLVLKQELDERGKGPDAAAYAWHICTFALGLGSLLAPSRGPEPPPPAEVHAHATFVRGGHLHAPCTCWMHAHVTLVRGGHLHAPCTRQAAADGVSHAAAAAAATPAAAAVAENTQSGAPDP